MSRQNPENLLSTLAKVGICKTGKRYLRTTPRDMDTVIKCWKNWAEYFIEHSDFSLKTIRQFVSEDMKRELHANNLFVDLVGSVTIGSDNAVFVMGDSDVTITIEDWAVVKIYAFNNAKIKLIEGQRAYINIEAYNSAHVVAEAANDAKVTVYQYDNSIAEGSANIHKKEYNRGEVFNGKEIPGYVFDGKEIPGYEMPV